ncbi:lipopolysaccharide biosynthesis protein [Cellulomonas xiejunii]|uniref:lipopolysaccharide biosynthesis protein n=1 Tax=Cellulomonas xiejunii TaxID=2968083 RepID=UPI001D0EE1BB|nr:polysaccharide biosynthesis C-terminal domain-containing protein [Cellulomonas xiejunii]MCC2314575.1 polysaccharide biosynthesis C-terminal domain-containing protein [Cellulomonas xiejunii]
MTKVTRSVRSEEPERDADRRSLARGGVVSFAGAAWSAVCGFGLTIVLARVLGDTGAGLVLQAVGVFSIALALSRLGMDSASLWIVPRLLVDRVVEVRGAVVHLAVTALLGGALGSVVLVVLARVLWHDAPLGAAVGVVAWFLPPAALALALLGALRGAGGVLPYVLVGNVALPTARPVGVLVATAAGYGATGAAVGWALPWVPAAGVVVALLWREVRRRERAAGAVGAPWWPSRERRRRVAAYAAPRTLSAGLDQVLVWLDVLLVGALLGAADAGVYGSAARFVAAGLVVDAAIRVVVAPRFSALLHEGRLSAVQDLYRLASGWLVLFATPLYLLVAVFASAILGLLGPGFERGAPALVVLCAGAVVTFLAGNIHSVLLMSGRSGWAAVNKVVVVAVNVGLNLVLLPVLGIVGAATAWAVSMLVDAVLATIEVRVLVGVRIDLARVLAAAALALVTVGLPAVVVRAVLGDGLGALLVAVTLAVAVFLPAVHLSRRRFELSVDDLRRRPSSGG